MLRVQNAGSSLVLGAFIGSGWAKSPSALTGLTLMTPTRASFAVIRLAAHSGFYAMNDAGP